MIADGAAVSSLLITCRNKSAVERHYIPALRRGGWRGGILLASPGDPHPDLTAVVGLLMTGGEDIHPRWWDVDEPVHATVELDEERDALEIPIARQAWALGLPILGICRGEQLLNVALGGSLTQDLAGQLGLDPGLHRRGSADVPEAAHTVAVAPGSRLATLIGTAEVGVNSRHHQAVLRVAPELRAVAWHRNPPLGEPLVEAIEALDLERWVLGVQWHPENLVAESNPMGEAARHLFQGFAAILDRR